MTNIFVCEWTKSVLETDDEGEDRDYLEPIYYSDHSSIEEAIACAGKGYLGYGMLTKKITAEDSENYWEPVCCICVLERNCECIPQPSLLAGCGSSERVN